MSIEKMFVCSTANLTEETVESYLAWHAEGWFTYPAVFEKGDYGYFIYAWDDAPVRPVPEDLQLVRDEAKRLGCDWIMIDRDAPEAAGLPVYEW